MPLPAKKFNKIIKKIEMECKAMLRGGLAEFLQFDEVIFVKKIELSCRPTYRYLTMLI